MSDDTDSGDSGDIARAWIEAASDTTVVARALIEADSGNTVVVARALVEAARGDNNDGNTGDELFNMNASGPAVVWPDGDHIATVHPHVMSGVDGDAFAVLVAAAPTVIRELCDEVERLRRDLQREKVAHGETVDQRDRAEEWADKLAYAVAPIDVIGEHSSGNSPWGNALDLVTPDAEVKRLRRELEAAVLRSIEARNPGIDMDEVRYTLLQRGGVHPS